MSEPRITVNGHLLSDGQAMTVRVALEDLAGDIMQDGLGEDLHGTHMTASYLSSIEEIRGFYRSGTLGAV